ncbi:hypothetical protein ACOMHN_040418 [Nucella lapillus]
MLVSEEGKIGYCFGSDDFNLLAGWGITISVGSVDDSVCYSIVRCFPPNLSLHSFKQKPHFGQVGHTTHGFVTRKHSHSIQKLGPTDHQTVATSRGFLRTTHFRTLRKCREMGKN